MKFGPAYDPNKWLKALGAYLIFLTLVVYQCKRWPDSISNPANDPYIIEVAFNLGINPSEVTQAQFDDRYLND